MGTSGLATNGAASSPCAFQTFTSPKGWSITLHGAPPYASGATLSGIEITGTTGDYSQGTAPAFANGITLGTPSSQVTSTYPTVEVQTGQLGDRYVTPSLGSTKTYIDNADISAGSNPGDVVQSIGIGPANTYGDYCS